MFRKDLGTLAEAKSEPKELFSGKLRFEHRNVRCVEINMYKQFCFPILGEI